MKPEDIYEVLRGIRVTHLHHANSVVTSCSFLQVGGLVSRGMAEANNLSQTPQPMSDDLDKKFGIWNCLFVDHVDIHERGGRVRGPNKYGPVLFVFDVDVLLKMPPGTQVLVTKSNPIHWWAGQADADRWFLSREELSANLNYGAFDKMLVIQTPVQKLDFPNRSATIFLDDPQRQISSGTDAYSHAKSRLIAAAAAAGIAVSIDPHECRPGCICGAAYAGYAQQKVDFYFS